MVHLAGAKHYVDLPAVIHVLALSYSFAPRHEVYAAVLRGLRTFLSFMGHGAEVLSMSKCMIMSVILSSRMAAATT